MGSWFSCILPKNKGPYHTDLPTPEEIHQFLQFQRVDPNRTIKSKNVILSPNQVLTKELRQDLKIWEELIRENVIKSARASPKGHLPYGMFLTRIFRNVMEHYPHPDNGIYNAVDRVMRPLALKQTRKPRRDDDEDDGDSRASTPSPTTYLNSLKPLNHQQYDIPTSSEQDDDLLFERQTDLLNQTQQMHKELRGGFKSFGKALRGVFGKKRNEDVE
ncbi:hypothetical protein Tco_0828572 [Tanacetum coccineum]